MAQRITQVFTRGLVPAVLAGALAGGQAVAASSGQDPLLTRVAAAPSVLGRHERDHKIAMAVEKYQGEKAVHVYTTLTDFDAPYSFSLGWFVMVQSKGGEACLDEFGERLPLPGAKPSRMGFNKADLSLLRGFDLASEGNLKEAASAFESAVRLAPENARAHNNLGASLAALGQFKRAEQEVDKALALKEDYALALANKAWIELLTGRPGVGVDDANKAVALEKALKPAVLAVGKAYIEFGRTAEAVTVCERAFGRWPDDPQTAILAGDANAANGDLKSARLRYQKAMVYGPNNPRVLLKIAAIAEHLGDLDDAIRKARLATQAKPEDPEPHLALGRYLEQNRESRGAQIQFERALELDPPPAMKMAIFGPLARVLINTNRYDEADKLSASFLKDNPNSPDCHFNRAWVLSQMPDPEHKAEAIKEYKKAAALNPALAQAHYNLGLLLAGQGRAGEAETELKTFIQKAPHDPDVGSAKELLKKLGQ